jgi:hypothetical protein
LLELQNQYEDVKKIIDNGVTGVSTFFGEKLVINQRPLTALEIAKLHTTIKDLRKEISEIEGDYAPKEVEQNHTIKIERVVSK